MNLEQKLVELRKLLPYIKKEKQSQYIKYKSYKLDDIWQLIQLKMNELGINTRIIDEQNGKYTTYNRDITKYDSNKKPYQAVELMFLYESDLTIAWINVDNKGDNFEKKIHVIGSNNDPAKAKGSSYTYAFKYDLSYMFSIPMGEIDPDSFDTDQQQKLTKLENKHKDIKMIDAGQKKTILQQLKQLHYNSETAPKRMEETTGTNIFDMVTRDGALLLIASLNKETKEEKL